jgi:hypothetical protein
MAAGQIDSSAEPFVLDSIVRRRRRPRLRARSQRRRHCPDPQGRCCARARSYNRGQRASHWRSRPDHRDPLCVVRSGELRFLPLRANGFKSARERPYPWRRDRWRGAGTVGRQDRQADHAGDIGAAFAAVLSRRHPTSQQGWDSVCASPPGSPRRMGARLRSLPRPRKPA